MSAEEIKLLKAFITATIYYYNQTIKDEVLLMYVEDLQDLPWPLVKKAMIELRRDPKINRFPLPAMIRNLINPTDTPDQIARDTALKMTGAVEKFGWCNHERAREYIGPVGWEVIKKMGGWMEFNQILTYQNMPTLQAQLRELVLVGLQQAKRVENGFLKLPESPETRKLLDMISKSTNAMPQDDRE